MRCVARIFMSFSADEGNFIIENEYYIKDTIPRIDDVPQLVLTRFKSQAKQFETREDVEILQDRIRNKNIDTIITEPIL